MVVLTPYTAKLRVLIPSLSGQLFKLYDPEDRAAALAS